AETAQIARGMFDAAERFVANRLPELFAGLTRQPGTFPVQYLEANVPQAWAASAIFRFIAVLCGIHAVTDDRGSRLYIDPALPDWLPDLTMSSLRAGRGALSVRFADGEFEVLANTTAFEVVPGRAPTHGRVAGEDGGRTSGGGEPRPAAGNGQPLTAPPVMPRTK
ncbi:MAG: hypothetical protein ACRDIL_20550, partial [Candidatus Limnocylindrales bacterium]